MKIEFLHDKSDFVKRALSVKDEFDEEIKYPWIFWIPVIFLALNALDYFTYGLRETISQFFPEGDPSYPFVFGILFGIGYAISVFMLFLMRRFSIYWVIIVMIGEWFYFSGFDLLIFKIIDGQKIYYPMFGSGLVPGLDVLEPIFTLMARQLIIIISMFFIWRRLN